MIFCVIKQYFISHYKRWRNTFLILVVLGILLKYICPESFVPQGKPFILWDYIFSAFAEPIAVIVVIPILYCYLIADIITKDYEGGYITFLLSRIPNRTYYYISKIVVVLITSNLMVMIYMLALFIVAIVYRLPMQGHAYYITTKLVMESHGSIFSLLILQYGLFTMVLNALGIIILVLSLLFNNCVVPFIGTAILMVQGQNTIFADHTDSFYTLLVQNLLWMHTPFYYTGNEVKWNKLQKFTVRYSIEFLLGISLVFLIIGFFKIRKMNLSKKG